MSNNSSPSKRKILWFPMGYRKLITTGYNRNEDKSMYNKKFRGINFFKLLKILIISLVNLLSFPFIVSWWLQNWEKRGGKTRRKKSNNQVELCQPLVK